jgi:DNA-binding transcriptional MocR family regulator
MENSLAGWLPDKKKLQRPVYVSLAATIEQDIAEGKLKVGTRLPTQRDLADYLGINFTTVTRAYKLCEFKGLIYAITGNGTFVASNATQSICSTTTKLSEDSIELGFVASFEQPGIIAVDAIKKVSKKRCLHDLLNYKSPTGMLHQKRIGLKWMEAFGMYADHDQIAITAGTQNALVIVLISLFEPGQRIATDWHTYSNFIALARSLRIQLVPVAGDESGMLPNKLAKICKHNLIHGIFLMPSCCNPTTSMMLESRKKEIAAIIKYNDIILIEDDCHAFMTSEIIQDYGCPLYMLIPNNTIYLCGTSKSICSGLRIAYIVYPKRFNNKITQAIFTVNIKTSSLDAEIITELIQSGKASEIVARKKALAASANELFYSYFPQANRSGHPLSFYRWMGIDSSYTRMLLEMEMERLGVRVFHSSRFLSGPDDNKQYVRISLSSTKNMEELGKGLDILKHYLKM